MQFDSVRISDEIKLVPQWVCWKNEERNGKPTKIPINPNGGGMASTTNPATWGAFGAAVEACRVGGLSGIGFVFTVGDPYCGIDLDDCRDPNTGEVTAWAVGILDRLDSYSEVSPSGAGIKIIVKGKCPAGGNRRGSVEIYDHARYFAMTGWRLEDRPHGIEDRQEALNGVHAEFVARPKTTKQAEPMPEAVPGLGDDEIIRRASNAANGDKFRRLWGGDKSGYASDSEADLALCSILAFWTRGDFDAIDRLFRQSALFRPKWLRADYRRWTIGKATEGKEFHGSRNGRSRKGDGTGGTNESKAVPFPLEALPVKCRRLAVETAASMGCPVDFPGAMILGVASTCIGATRALWIKRDWFEAPRIYVAIVASPGAVKTPVIKAICSPLYVTQREWKARYDSEHADYTADMRDLERWLKRRDKSAVAEPRKPVKPTFRHLYTTDATTEKLAVALSENPRGFAMIQDELAGWIRSMNQYKGGKGSDRQFFLSAWAGSPIKVDRKSEEAGPIVVSAPYLNVFGGIQPDMLDEFQDDRGRQDGFIHRLLFSYPEQLPPIGWSEVEISREAETSWATTCGNLLSLEAEAFEDGTPCPALVKMDAKAREFFIAWKRDHADEQATQTFPPTLAGPWAKMENYLGRLTILIHCLRWGEGELVDSTVDAETVASACVLCEYFKAHANRVYATLKSTVDDKRVSKIAAWIRNRGGHATARELVVSQITDLRKTSEVKAVFADMQDRGLGTLKISSVSTGGHPLIEFEMGKPE